MLASVYLCPRGHLYSKVDIMLIKGLMSPWKAIQTGILTSVPYVNKDFLNSTKIHTLLKVIPYNSRPMNWKTIINLKNVFLDICYFLYPKPGPQVLRLKNIPFFLNFAVFDTLNVVHASSWKTTLFLHFS